MNLNELFDHYRNTPSEYTLTEVLKASQNLIYGIIVKVANHDHDSEDLTQEVLIKVIQNINILPKDTNFGGWLNRTSLNAAINFYHQKQRIKTLSPKIQDLKKNQNGESAEETIAIIYQHLSQLESTEESLILNKYIHQMTYAQMSSIYQLPKSTIESKINNILGKLKVSIEKAGFAGVALAITSTFDQLKATEVSFDLIPQLQKHFPASYPKVKSKLFSSKTLLKVAVPLVAILISYFAIDYLASANPQNNYPTNEVTKKEKSVKAPSQLNQIEKTPQENSSNELKENSKNEALAAIQKPIEDIKPTLPIMDEKKATNEIDFAGQLIDAETKKPIAEAKLEIWDIYTYEKFETITDAEGKYFVPKGLDTTFFFYLKFIKDGYAVKQTFQHFEIHKNILVEMSNRKKRRYKLLFDRPTSSVIYIGSKCNLELEQHLSYNQKQALQQIIIGLMTKAPIELYSIKKINIEKTDNYSIEENFENSEGDQENFGIWYRNPMEKKISYFRSGGCSFGDIDYKGVEIKLASNNKKVINKELEVYNHETKKYFYILTNNEGLAPIYSREFFQECLFTIDGLDYFAHSGMKNSRTGALDNSLSYSMWDPKLDERKLFSYPLFPYVSMLFDPLSLNNEFHDSQALLVNDVFSKKSVFKKSKESSGVLKMYDKYFEKILISSFIKTSIGGAIDLNEKLINSNFKEIKIRITLNSKQMKDATIEVFIDNSKILPEKIHINEGGVGLIQMPIKSKELMVKFSIDKVFYSKIIELNTITDDCIELNFNRKLDIKVSQKVLDLNKKGYDLAFKNLPQQQGHHTVTFVDQISRKPYNYLNEKKQIVNSNTAIIFSNSESSIFVEEEIEYTIIDDYGYGVKTSCNQLRAINTQINSITNTIEVIPVSDLDYTSIHVDISDENGNEIKDMKWSIDENRYKFDNGFLLYRAFIPKEEGDLYGYSENYYKDMTVGEEVWKNKTVFLLNNREYQLEVEAEGYINYQECFSTNEHRKLNKKVILRKSNSIMYRASGEGEFVEITKLLKSDDIIYEYNGVRIINKEIMWKALQECKQEKVTIKLIRENVPMSLVIPACSFGFEENHYDDKEGILNNN